MKTNTAESPTPTHIFEREFHLLNDMKPYLENKTLPLEDILTEFNHLYDEYEKLLKKTIKITKIGDSNQKRLLSAYEQIEYQKEELNIAYNKLDQISRTDTLTQLSNRRDFLEQSQLEIHRFERNGKPFSIILADIDNFKAINDQHGHDAGDFILSGIATLMKSSIRKLDVVARWGGEEFIFLLPQTFMEGGKILADEIRRKIQTTPFVYNGTCFSITITLGISEFNGECDIDSCIKKADQALYLGKRNGKNCIFSANEVEIDNTHYNTIIKNI